MAADGGERVMQDIFEEEIDIVQQSTKQTKGSHGIEVTCSRGGPETRKQRWQARRNHWGRAAKDKKVKRSRTSMEMFLMTTFYRKGLERPGLEWA